MLSSSHPQLATEVTYVAGDRVVTDALCKPFSMGRNLFCVHSKKRMDDEPELKAQKMETNRKTLVAMQRAFNAGGSLVWIAPSGGRDRPKDDVWSPDKFDAAAVELMRNLINRAKQPGHLYPMTMFSYPIMPPPKTIDKELGERRLTAWSGVGISLCEELDWQNISAGIEDKEAAHVRGPAGGGGAGRWKEPVPAQPTLVPCSFCSIKRTRGFLQWISFGVCLCPPLTQAACISCPACNAAKQKLACVGDWCKAAQLAGVSAGSSGTTKSLCHYLSLPGALA